MNAVHERINHEHAELHPPRRRRRPDRGRDRRMEGRAGRHGRHQRCDLRDRDRQIPRRAALTARGSRRRASRRRGRDGRGRRTDHHVRDRPFGRLRDPSVARGRRARSGGGRRLSAGRLRLRGGRKPPAERRVRSSVGVIAKPPIRKLARDLGVDLTAVTATGADGEVTRDDVMNHASQASVFRNIQTPAWGAVREETVPAPQTAPTGLARGVAPVPASVLQLSQEPSPDARTESIPVKGVRKATSSAMVQSAYSAPHVTVWKEIDASRTMELVKRLKAAPEYADIRVSPLLIMARAVIWAARRTPMVNAAWVETENGAEIHVRHYVNLGIAAATPRGLLVPNIKDAQDLGMKDLARALNRLTLTAREGKTSPADPQR